MDWIHTPYRGRMRFSEDPGAPLVNVYWYFTDLPFVEFPTAFGSRYYRDWDGFNSILGEYEEKRRRLSPHWQLDGLTGLHTCGDPEEFLHGIAWPYYGPPIEVDVDWIPTCCGRLPIGQVTAGAFPGATTTHQIIANTFVTAGSYPGAEVHARAKVEARVTAGAYPGSRVEYFPPFTTRVAAGSYPGAEVHARAKVEARVTAGAYPGAEVTYFPAFTTRVAAGAYPGAEVRYRPSMTARVAAGAYPGAEVTYTNPRVAMVTAGAFPGAEVTYTPVVSAGVTAGAFPGAEVTYTPVVSAGVTAGAYPGAEVTYTNPRIAMVTAGAFPGAEVTYTPGGVTPGATCATAGAILPGQSYSGNTAIHSPDWFTFMGTFGVQYTVTISGTGTVGTQTRIYDGGACPGPSLSVTFNNAGSRSIIASANNQCWIQVSIRSGGSAYTVTLSSP